MREVQCGAAGESVPCACAVLGRSVVQSRACARGRVAEGLWGVLAGQGLEGAQRPRHTSRASAFTAADVPDRRGVCSICRPSVPVTSHPRGRGRPGWLTPAPPQTAAAQPTTGAPSAAASFLACLGFNKTTGPGMGWDGLRPARPRCCSTISLFALVRPLAPSCSSRMCTVPVLTTALMLCCR